MAYTRLGRAVPTPNVQLYTVARRSFPIVLEEKGELKAINTTDIRCELEGRSTVIWVIEEGTRVRKGDKLVELACDEIENKIRQAEIDVTAAQAAYEAAQKDLQILIGKNESEIRAAEVALWLAEQTLLKYKEGEAVELRQKLDLALKKAEKQYEQARDTLKDSEELYQKGYITRIDLEQDRFREYSSQIEVQTAKLALKVADEFTIPMNIADLQSKVDKARQDLDRARKEAAASEAKSRAELESKEGQFRLKQENLAKLKDQKSKATILAPTEGLVVYYKEGFWDDFQMKAGASVHERQILIQLPDTSRMKVVVRIHEAKTEMVKPGLPATVEVEGLAGQQFHGRVTKIAVLAAPQMRWMNPNLKEYETEIELDGTFTNLKPNVTARAPILVTELRNVLAVPVQAVFSKGDKHYVFVDQKGEPSPLEVRLGLASSEYVEIKDGLREGQTVYLAVPEEARLKLPEVQDAGRERRRGPRPPVMTRPVGAESRPASRRARWE